MSTKPILFAMLCMFSLLFSSFDNSHTIFPLKNSSITTSLMAVEAKFIDVSCMNPPATPLICITDVVFPFSDFKVGDKAWVYLIGKPPVPLNGIYQVYSDFSNIGDTFIFVDGVAVSTATPC